MKRFLLCGLFSSLMAASSACAQDDVMDKIRQLELQILELKTLKEQQNISDKKTEQCMKAISRESFCTCIGINLPRDVSFEQYVHTLVTTKIDLGYDDLSVAQKQVIDATIAVRDKCVDKGFFK